MQGTVLQIMNYAASYRGNFIDSLKSLDEKLQKKGLKSIYLFCKEALDGDSKIWIDKMQEEGNVIEYLSENVIRDSKLIKRLIREHHVLLIHSHFITMPQYLSIYKATLGNKVPVIMHFHNHSVETKNIVKSVLRKALYRKCMMVACSESVYESLKRDYPKNRKCFVDNGVNFSRLDRYMSITNEEYGVEEGNRVFLIFGFDYYRKGVDLAVEALQKLREAGNNFTLLISLSKNFEVVEKNIFEKLGTVPEWIKIIKARNDVASLYNYVDLFLSPSREEGLPYSVVEAGYSNCSVVLSDISAQAKLKLKYAVWFQDGNVDGLVQAIQEALEQCEKKKNDMMAVKAYMMEQYSLEQWSEKIMNTYMEEIKNAKL